MLSVIDVASGEYGHEYVERMITQVDNGRCYNWSPNGIEYKCEWDQENDESKTQKLETEFDTKRVQARSSNWEQFCILYRRRTIQMWRDSVNIN